MGRKRKQADSWMPARVYRGRSAYEYRPNNSTNIRLCSLDATRAVVIKRHAEEYERYHTRAGTVKALFVDYFDSPQFLKLKPSTQKDYKKHSKPALAVFGKVDARKVKPEHVRIYMDKKGLKSETQANRQFSLMSRVFAWGYERGRVSINPCKGVSKFSEKPREVYVTDEQYNALYSVAVVQVRVAMEIAYLCAARKGDILSLMKTQLLKDGIDIKQGKTGKRQIKGYTPRLKAALKLAESIPTKNGSLYVIPTKSGTGYSESGFDSLMQKAKREARKKFKDLSFNFTFHDLKAKGISDYKGDKQKFSGHKTPSQVAIYDRKTEIVETLKTGRKPSE